MSSLKQEGANFREMRNAEYFSQFSDHHFLSPLCIPDGRSVRSLKRAAADQRSPGSGSLYLPPPPAAESRLNNLQLWIYCIYFDALMVALKTKGQAVAMSADFPVMCNSVSQMCGVMCIYIVSVGTQLPKRLDEVPGAFVSCPVQSDSHGVLLQQSRQPFVHRQVFITLHVEQLQTHVHHCTVCHVDSI